MRSRVVRAGAALFMATAAFVPAHLAAASSDNGSQNAPGFQCPADQALFDQIKAWIVEFGPQLADPSLADPALQPQLELLASLALLSDEELCLTLTGSGGDGGGDTTSTTESGTSTTEPESTTSTSDNSTTSTTENTTTTVPEETTTTTAQETTTTTSATTTTTAKATTTTTAATTSTTAAATTTTTGATSTTEAHTTTDPTVGGVVVTSAGTLPRTGNDPAPLVALASLTAGLGVFLLVLRRRFAS